MALEYWGKKLCTISRNLTLPGWLKHLRPRPHKTSCSPGSNPSGKKRIECAESPLEDEFFSQDCIASATEGWLTIDSAIDIMVATLSCCAKQIIYTTLNRRRRNDRRPMVVVCVIRVCIKTTLLRRWRGGKPLFRSVRWAVLSSNFVLLLDWRKGPRGFCCVNSS